MAAGDELALFAKEGRVVDGEEHTHCGLVDLDGRQWFGVLVVADGIADFEQDVLVEVEQHSANLAGFDGVLGALLAEALEGVELLHLAGNLALIALDKDDGLASLQGAAIEASHCDTSEVAAVIQRRKHHLGVAFGDARCGDMLDNEVHQVADVLRRGLPVGAHPALFGGAVGGGEVQLVVGGAEVEHQVEDSLLRQLGVAVGLVHLVDDHDGLETQLDGFLKHKAGLGHGAFEGVHHQQHAVGHIQHTLHLAAEVAVARGVDDVDFVSFVADRNVLGENGDATLAFKVVVVKNEFAGLLILTKELCLVQHTVDQGGFSVVDMRNNGNISNVLHRLGIVFKTCKDTKKTSYSKKIRQNSSDNVSKRDCAGSFPGGWWPFLSIAFCVSHHQCQVGETDGEFLLFVQATM